MRRAVWRNLITISGISIVVTLIYFHRTNPQRGHKESNGEKDESIVLKRNLDNWCKTHNTLPNGLKCRQSHDKILTTAPHIETKNVDTSGLEKYLASPHPYRITNDTDKKYAQAKQDEVVYGILKKDSGFFIEIGALDGQLFSNTLWLERKHKWTGLLIEANPDLCKKVDSLKRHAWRLCACLSSTDASVTFIKGHGVGGVEAHVDQHHMKMLNKTNRVTVPCFSMENVLNKIGVHHIDFYSLDVEGAEMVILESMRKELTSRKMVVDVWTIEYRVWDGKQVVVEKSLENLNNLRTFFKSVGGYKEHVQLSNDGNTKDGYALDVVFVNKDLKI